MLITVNTHPKTKVFNERGELVSYVRQLDTERMEGGVNRRVNGLFVFDENGVVTDIVDASTWLYQLDGKGDVLAVNGRTVCGTRYAPPGWFCIRNHEHGGPCGAMPL